MTAMASLGWLWLGCILPTLLFALLGIAIYGIAQRYGPATGALSALMSLVLLTVVPTLGLWVMPKWWTLNWAPTHLAQPDRGRSPELDNSLAQNGNAISSTADEPEFAKENRTGQQRSELPLPQDDGSREHPTEGALPSKGTWDQLPAIIGIALIAGWCFALARFLLGLRAAQRFRFSAMEITDPPTIDLVQTIAMRLDFPGSIRLFQANELLSAATVGWLHPVILLPANWKNWTTEELRVVLAHEIAHIARSDYLTWLIAQFSLSLHFYHPLAYWLIRRLRRDQELAADLVGSELCGGKEKYLVTLSQLVLNQSSRPAPCFSRSIFSARGTFLWRMKMLHAQALFGSARLKRFPVLVLGLSSLVIALACAGVGFSFEQSNEQPPKVLAAPERGRIEGQIRAADTGKPVEGAMVRLLIEGDPAVHPFLEVFTDKKGRYTQELPLGNVILFGLVSPAGYYTQDEKTRDFTAVTKEEPVLVRDFSLQSGMSWKVELADYSPSKERVPSFITSIDPERYPRKSSESLHALANAKGEAVVTIPRTGGNCQVRCIQRETVNRFQIPLVNLDVDEDFAPALLQGEPVVNPADQSVRLKDRAGKTAMVTGAQVVNRNGHAVLRIPCKLLPHSPGFKVEGVVQDEKGAPIAGAKITPASGTDWGGSPSPYVTYSAKDGKFAIPELKLSPTFLSRSKHLKMLVNKPGWIGVETKEVPLAEVQKSGSPMLEQSS